jgi:hypothetical protein
VGLPPQAAPAAITGMPSGNAVSLILGIKKLKKLDAGGTLDAGGDDNQINNSIFLWGLSQ